METTSLTHRIAKNLKHYRKLCGYTQAELADDADVDISTIRRIEQEDCVSIRTATLEKIAAQLSIDPLLLFTDFTENESSILSNLIFGSEGTTLLTALKKII